MGVRLIDVDKLIDVLLEERETLFESQDCDSKGSAMFDAVSECISIVNHFPEYVNKDDVPIRSVGNTIKQLLQTSNSEIVLKRCDTGREYRKIKDALDDKNFWEVTGFMPRIKADGSHAKIEMVLLCRDRNQTAKDLYNDIKFRSSILQEKRCINDE